jgi:hypothetical protein
MSRAFSDLQIFLKNLIKNFREKISNKIDRHNADIL